MIVIKHIDISEVNYKRDFVEFYHKESNDNFYSINSNGIPTHKTFEVETERIYPTSFYIRKDLYFHLIGDNKKAFNYGEKIKKQAPLSNGF